MQYFRKLDIWKRSHQLTLNIYTITKTFPKNELFGLSSQMRKSSSSMPPILLKDTEEIPVHNSLNLSILLLALLRNFNTS